MGSEARELREVDSARNEISPYQRLLVDLTAVEHSSLFKSKKTRAKLPNFLELLHRMSSTFFRSILILHLLGFSRLMVSEVTSYSLLLLYHPTSKLPFFRFATFSFRQTDDDDNEAPQNHVCSLRSASDKGNFEEQGTTIRRQVR